MTIHHGETQEGPSEADMRNVGQSLNHLTFVFCLLTALIFEGCTRAKASIDAPKMMVLLTLNLYSWTGSLSNVLAPAKRPLSLNRGYARIASNITKRRTILLILDLQLKGF